MSPYILQQPDPQPIFTEEELSAHMRNNLKEAIGEDLYNLLDLSLTMTPAEVFRILSTLGIKISLGETLDETFEKIRKAIHCTTVKLNDELSS